MNDISISYIRHARRVPPAMRLGRLSSHEVTIVMSGSMTYIVDGVSYLLNAKDVIFIPCMTKRERLTQTDECNYVSINFNSEPPSLPTIMRGACHSEIMLLISALDRIKEKPELPFDERAPRIVAVMLSLLCDYERAGKMSRLTRQILEYAHAEYKNKVRLSDIAAATFFSAEYCESVFKRDTGRSIIDYVLELRISEAQRLIIEGALGLGVIADEVGFTDYNYFSRTFKRRTGYSPTAYRRMMRREA